MSGLVDRLRETLRQHYLARLPPDQARNFATSSLDDLLIDYGTWRSRFVTPRPRKAHLSRELRSSPKYLQHQTTLDELVRQIEAGDDLTPHLSTRVRFAHDAAATGKEPGQRKDRDPLVADWGIHHLHLSTDAGPSGFKGRTNDLLFVVFAADDAYLIDIYPHRGSWAMLELLEIYVRNWPDAGTLQRSRYAVGLSQQYSDADRFELRSAGITGAVEIDGSVYMPPGQTTTGGPLRVLIKADNFMVRLRELADIGESALLESLNRDAQGTAATGEWEPLVLAQGFGFVSNGVFLRLGGLPWD